MTKRNEKRCRVVENLRWAIDHRGVKSINNYEEQTANSSGKQRMREEEAKRPMLMSW